MKALKVVLYVVGALVLLVAAAVLAATLLFDPNAFKPRIERLVKDATQRTLKLEGELGLAFFPSLGVSLGKATLSERASEATFASLESGRVSVALLPLFRGEAVVDEVRIAGVKASIVRRKDGRSNIDDLLEPGVAKPEPKAAPPSSGPAGPPLKLDISGVRLERASLSYRDEGTGQELVLDGLDLRTGRIVNDVPGSLRVSTAIRGKNPALNVKIDLSADYRFNLAQKTFALSKLDARASGDAAGVSGLALTAKGALSAQPEAGRFGATDLLATAQGTFGEDAFEARISAPKLAIEADKASGADVTADLKLTGKQRSGQAKLKLAGVQGSAEAVSIVSLALEFDAQAGDASAKGSLTTPVRANLAKRIYELPKLAATITASSPALPQKTVTIPLTGSARADLGKESVAAEIAAKLDDTSLKAKLGLTQFAAPHYAFDLDIDRLNVDRYFPPKPAAESKPSASKPVPEADTPVDLSALKGLRANGSLAIGEIIVQRVKLSSVKAQIRLADGRLEVSPHSAGLYGGTVSGSIAANAEGNRIVVKETLQNVAAGPLIKDLLERDLIEGRGDIALDVAAAGASVNAMKRSLSGSARIAFKDGAVKGINLAESFRKAKAALGSKSAQQQLADRTQKTDFSELSASFTIRNGVAHNDDLTAKSPFLRLGGSGDIDIGNSTLNYTARASVVTSARGQGGSDLAHVAGLTVPVKLTGPFDAIKFDIDYGSGLRDKAKSKIEERLKESLPGGGGAGAAPPADRVKERLRNLLRR